MNRTENSIWVEKYRPITLDDFIGNDHIVDKIKIYLETNDIPMLLLFGPFGTGKTSISKIIVNSIECDYLYINAADENGVETIRKKVSNFASTVGFNDIKIVILDEAHQLTFQAQQILNNILEIYSKTTRFILTSNYIEKIAGSIVSRCQAFQVVPPRKPEVAARLAYILDAENVTYKKEDLALLVNSHFPDIRKIINTAQSFNVNGVLKLDKNEIIESNYFLKAIDLLINSSDSKKTYREIRQLFADNKVRQFEQFFRLLFENLEKITTDETRQAQIIIAIAEAQYHDILVLDHEINAMALVVRILEL